MAEGNASKFSLKLKPNPSTGCVEWIGGASPDGYVYVTYEGTTHLLQRAVYRQHVGPVPDQKVITLTCENRLCGNVNHLQLEDPNQKGKGGITKHPLYSTWRGMKNRCYQSGTQFYHRYGGRGIYVCDRWLNSFWDFVSDMGERPDGYTIDRIDNDGPYSPENCRWASRSAQNVNKAKWHKRPQPAATHCKSGHEYTPDNTAQVVGKNRSYRYCRTCRRAWNERQKLKNKGGAK